MSFRFVHAADLHLDTPFEGLAVRDPGLRERLVDASLDALDGLVELAVRERALFITLGGDIYDGAVRGLRAQARLHDATRRLTAAGIWTFIAHGNHDPVGEGWAAVRAWPERVRIFPEDRAETYELTAQDGTRVTVTGTSFPTRDVRTGLHARFPGPEGEGVHVAVLHANVGAASEHAPYSPARLEELVALGYDAWLLGHIHRRQVLRERPLVVYPGNLQGRSFKPSEQGAKGGLVVEVDRGELWPRFVELAPVRFEEVELDASDCEDVGAVVEALVERLEERGVTGTVVARARVGGRSVVYHDLAEDPSGEELLKALRDRGPAGVHWSAVSLDLRPPLDLDALRGRDDLQGQLVREWELLQSRPDEVRRILAGSVGVQELLRREDNEALQPLLERAGHLAAHLLGSS